MLQPSARSVFGATCTIWYCMEYLGGWGVGQKSNMNFGKLQTWYFRATTVTLGTRLLLNIHTHSHTYYALSEAKR